MYRMRCVVLVVAYALSLGTVHADEPKKADKDTWAKIVVDLISPEASKKGIEIQQNAAVPPDFELNFDIKKLGADGKFSAKQFREKYGAPLTIEKYATREGTKVVTYEKWNYPPIGITFPVGGDQATTITATKKLWGGEGILENARAAMKSK